MLTINLLYSPHNVWILKRVSDTNGTLLPHDIINYILQILKPKPQIMCGFKTITIIDRKGIHFTNSDWMNDYKIPIYDIKYIFYDVDTHLKTHKPTSKRPDYYPLAMHKDGTLRSYAKPFNTIYPHLKIFMIKNNISGIKKAVIARDYLIILTNCQQVISWGFLYSSNHRNYFRVLFGKEYGFKKVYALNNVVLLLDKDGRIYTFNTKNLHKYLFHRTDINNVIKVTMVNYRAYLIFADRTAGLWEFHSTGYKNLGLSDVKKIYADVNSADMVMMYLTRDNKLYYDLNRVELPFGHICSVYFGKDYYVTFLQSDDADLPSKTSHRRYYFFAWGNRNNIMADTNMILCNNPITTKPESCLTPVI